MSKSNRTAAARGAKALQEDPVPLGPFPSTDDAEVLEPDTVAASVMVERAFAASSKLRKIASRPEAILVVEIPSEEWAVPIQDTWRSMVLGYAASPVSQRSRSDRGDIEDDVTPPVQILLRTTAQRKFSPNTDTFLLHRAINRGEGLVAISQAPEAHLIEDMLRVADYRIRISGLDGNDLALVASRLTRSPATRVFPAELTPLVKLSDLWLASRPGGKADAWLDRLEKLVSAKVAQRASSSDRVPTLDDLHGMDAAVAWGRSLASDLAGYRAGQLGWEAIDRGAVLHGLPGTGKTAFAKALAGSCGVPLVTASYAEWQSNKDGHLGHTLSAMRKSFEQAKQSAPCILLIDELDSFPVRAEVDSRHRDYVTSVVNGLLEQLDGAAGREGVVVIGTTNHVDRIDPAILRAGRMDALIGVPLPGAKALASILRAKLGANLGDADLLRAASRRMEATGADAEKWARGALRRARQDGGRAVRLADVEAEVRGGSARLDRVTLERVAIHEAGHALMSVLAAPGTLRQISTLSHAGYLGHTACTLNDVPLLLTGPQLDIRLQYMLAGRAAERLLCHHVTSGAGGRKVSDLAKATLLATEAETRLGLGTDERNILWLGRTRSGDLTDLFAKRPDLEKRVRARLDAAYASVEHSFEPLHDVLTELVRRLMEQETLDGPAVEVFVHTWLANSHLRSSGLPEVFTKRHLEPSVADDRREYQADLPSKSSKASKASSS